MANEGVKMRLERGRFGRLNTLYGILPVEILSIKGKSGPRSRKQIVTVVACKSDCGHRIGDIIKANALCVAPKESMINGRVKDYLVVCDQDSTRQYAFTEAELLPILSRHTVLRNRMKQLGLSRHAFIRDFRYEIEETLFKEQFAHTGMPAKVWGSKRATIGVDNLR